MKIQLTSMLYIGFHSVLDWVYPPICVGCGEPGFCVCPDCKVSISFINQHFCQICGGTVKREMDCCDDCQFETPPYKAIRNLAHYEGVIRECLHALKYENNQPLGGFFSEQLITIILREGWQIDLITPVPLSSQRMHERGYNQSALIARPLAAHLSIRYNPFCLKRVRHTTSQVGLSLNERRRNVSGAFEAVTEIVAGKKVLLVDDVMTTGATLNACSEALTDAGAIGVYCLTIARFTKRLPESNLHYHQV